jgi:hypothetical protein
MVIKVILLNNIIQQNMRLVANILTFPNSITVSYTAVTTAIRTPFGV